MPLSPDGYFDSFRGAVNTWECDDNGHMNVQFYVARASDGAFFLRHELGLSPSVIRGTGRTMVALEEHFRFHRELHAGDMMAMRSRLIDMREKTLVVYHELLNAGTGETAATVVAVSAHFDMETRKLVPWPESTVAKGRALIGPLPEHAQARSVKRETRLPDLTLDEASERGFIEIYRGPVAREHCDDFGHMATQFYISRYSDGSGHMWQGLGMERKKMLEARRGSVVLEQRLNYVREVLSGDILIVKSALIEVAAKTIRICHFMFNGETGLLAATSEVTVIRFDLDKRRATDFTPEEHALLKGHIRSIAKAAP
ncbi:MAG: thioesterase family protein [Parvibaculum sp.]|uniref:thioesterase family protein n=1 Tax=Parvibaculum sp. TaxID=2024848 RepID=UPI0025E15662|nr:thioesterase family protein [Parvibaculum sp.]MCE9649744.1 thioesterase family protein [Parvibaculum sp.]